MRRWLPHAIALAAVGGTAILGACEPFGSDRDEERPVEATDTDAGAVDDDPGGLNTTGVGAGTGANTGLPCDVQQLLENRCIGCHLASSRIPLLSHADLMKPSKTDPAVSMADRALARMKDTANPMPPPPAVPPIADEIAVLEGWLMKNAPLGEASCTPPATPDAGVDTTNYDTPRVCTSQKMWVNQTGGRPNGPGGPGGWGRGGGRDDEDEEDGSPEMDPGQACINCHNQRGGPAFQIAGTVYPTAHEPDDCYGVNGGVEVVVTDLQGAVIRTLPVNRAGNFFDTARIPVPFRVKIKRGTSERAMATAITAGDCNSCHTLDGANNAPGRVMAP